MRRARRLRAVRLVAFAPTMRGAHPSVDGRAAAGRVACGPHSLEWRHGGGEEDEQAWHAHGTL